MSIELRSYREIELLVKALLCDNTCLYDAIQMGYQFDPSYENSLDLECPSILYGLWIHPLLRGSVENCN